MAQKDYKLEIVAELLKGANHVRGIAKRINTNHMMISRKIRELAAENAVDYDEEGKNKKYHLKKTVEARHYALAAESYKLNQLLKKHPLLRRIADRIQADNKIKMALIFGSYAKGTARQDSDIDLYVETEDRKIKEALSAFDTRLSVKIGSYDKKSILMKEIEKDHIVLKGAEEFYEKNGLFH